MAGEEGLDGGVVVAEGGDSSRVEGDLVVVVVVGDGKLGGLGVVRD